MKQYTIYECEACGKTSKNAKEIEECEASHYTLSIEDFHKWQDLKNEVKRTMATLNVVRNELTIKMSDAAVEELLKFEKEHNLDV